jgi:hypothetical protein
LEGSIPITPVYFDYEMVNAEKPDWQLLAPDMMHPTWACSYLIACVLYGMIFKRSPEGLDYNPEIVHLSKDEIRYLQQMAWKAIKTSKF